MASSVQDATLHFSLEPELAVDRAGSAGQKTGHHHQQQVTPSTLLLLPAVKEGNYTRVKNIISGAEINVIRDDKGWTPLHWAAFHGYTEIAKLLIKYGSAIDPRENDPHRHWTPLHLATWKGHADLVNLLLDSGAAANAKTANGRTALSLAAERKHRELVKTFMMHKAPHHLEGDSDPYVVEYSY